VRGGYERSIVIIASLLVACSEDPRPTQQTAPPVVEETVDGYRVLEMEDAGSIAGQLRWVGERPTLAPLVATSSCIGAASASLQRATYASRSLGPGSPK